MTAEKRYVKRIGWILQWRLRRGREWRLMPDRKIYDFKKDVIAAYAADDPGQYRSRIAEGIWRLKPVYVEVKDET